MIRDKLELSITVKYSQKTRIYGYQPSCMVLGSHLPVEVENCWLGEEKDSQTSSLLEKQMERGCAIFRLNVVTGPVVKCAAKFFNELVCEPLSSFQIYRVTLYIWMDIRCEKSVRAQSWLEVCKVSVSALYIC